MTNDKRSEKLKMDEKTELSMGAAEHCANYNN